MHGLLVVSLIGVYFLDFTCFSENYCTLQCSLLQYCEDCILLDSDGSLGVHLPSLPGARGAEPGSRGIPWHVPYAGGCATEQ